MGERITRYSLWIMVGVLLLTALLGALGLQADSIWYDERLSLYYAGGAHEGPLGPLEIVTRISDRASGQAPLYYLLLSAWGSVAGWSAFAGRALSWLFGILAVALAYRLASDIAPPRERRLAGLMAALILGASTLFIAYLHEMRTYTLLVLLVLLSVTLYRRLITTSKPPRWLFVAFPLAMTATLYTHAFSAPVMGALGVYHLIFAPRGRRWWIMLGLFALSALLYVPWSILILQVIANRTAANTRALTAKSNGEMLLATAEAYSNGFWPLLALLIPSLLVIRRRAMAWMAFLIAVTLAAFLVANQIAGMINHVRYMLPLWGLVAVFAGAGLALVARSRYRLVLVPVLALWLILGVVNAGNLGNEFYSPEEQIVFHFDFPLAEVGEILHENTATGDAVAFYVPYHGWAMRGTFNYYVHGIGARYIVTDELGTEGDPDSFRAGFEHFVGDAGRVWLTIDHTVEATDRLAIYQSILDDRYVACGRVLDDPAVTIDVYAQIPLFCEPPDSTRVQFGESVQLTGIEHTVTDSTLTIYSTWSTDVPPDTYSVSFQLIDAEGESGGQLDEPVPLGDFAYRITRIHDIAPGEYTVRGIVYNWQTGERLITPEGEDIATLFTVTVGE